MCIIFLLFFSLISSLNCSTAIVLKSAIEKEKSHHILINKDEIIGKLIVAAKTEEKVVALTFDDGPNFNTTKLIKLLKEEECPATFFLIGGSLKNKKRILFLYKDPLFEIGMHGFYHDDYSKYSFKKLESEMENMIKVFSQYDLKSRYFRPPYGAVNYNLSQNLKKNSLIGVMWSIDSEDWKYKTSSKDNFVSNIIDSLEPGSIILLHEKMEISFIKSLVDNIRALDYKIVPLSEIINEDKIYCREIVKEVKFSYKNKE